MKTFVSLAVLALLSTADAKSARPVTLKSELDKKSLILEEEKKSSGAAFPVELLRQLVRLQDDALTDFVTHHLPRLTEIYLEARAALGESLDIAAGAAMETGEAVLIGQLAAVKEQLEQILDSLEIEEIEED